MNSAVQVDLATVLIPVRRRIALFRLERGAWMGLTVGAIAGALVLAASHVRSSPDARMTAWGLAAAGTIAGAAAALRRWPQPLEAARTVDRHFALQDRMTTALELQSEQDPLAQLQRRDLTRLLPGLRLADSVRRSHLGRVRVAAAAALVLLAMTSLWGRPAPRHAPTVAAAADHARIRHVALSSLPQIEKKLEAGLPPQVRNSPSFRQLLQSLARLRRKLLHTSSRSAALRAISALEQQLQRSASSLHTVTPQVATQLDASLKAYTTSGHDATSQQSAARSETAAAQTLSQLASSSTHLSAAQRGRLARALARTGNSVSDARLRADLQRAASSLANSDTRSAQASLRQAASLLQKSSATRLAESRISETNSRLDSLKSAISGLQAPLPRAAGGARPNGEPQSSQNQGTSRAGARQNAEGSPGNRPTTGGRQAATGSANGFTRSQSGRIAQAGAVSRNGTTAPGSAGSSVAQSGQRGKGIGPAAGSGGGGTGGHGSGGGEGQQGPRGSGKFVTVYLPGSERGGPQTSRRGSYGAPRQGIRVPYHEVLGRYTESAHAALDHSSLPPSLRSYVREYFSAISQ